MQSGDSLGTLLVYDRAYRKALPLVFGDFACRCQRSVEGVSFPLSSEAVGGASAEPPSVHPGSRFRAATLGNLYTLIAAQHPRFYLMFNMSSFPRQYIKLRS
jgi:hypothetical protein